jgi:uncharacterized OsmC-like protein
MTAGVTVHETIQVWREHPERALVRPKVEARADGEQAVLSAGSFSWRADLPASLGGTNTSASPTAALLGALAACAVVFIRDTLAPALGVRVTDVRATAQCSADFRGLLAMDGVVPDLQGLQIDIEITTPDGDDAARRLFQAWLARCPVYLALVKPTEVKTNLIAHA